MRNKKDLMHQLEMVGGSTMRVLIQSDTGEGSPQVSIGDIVMESCKPYIDSEGFSRNAHVVIKATGIIENVVKLTLAEKAHARRLNNE